MRGLREPVHRLCAEAAAAILPVYEAHLSGGDAGVDVKADASPVTDADRAAHDVLAPGLQALLDVPVVSEEGDVSSPGDARHWLVDPLDGTKEFLKGNGEFTVNVALVEAGRPVFGMVLVPVDGRAFCGVPGEGAWRRGDAWEPIRVVAPAGACRVVVSRSHRGEAVEAFLAALASGGFDVETVSVGSSLKLCQVACGQAHVYPRLGPTMHWDTAAAHAVVEAAGGSVVDLSGAPLRYGHGDLRNPWFVAGCEGEWHRFAPPDPSARRRDFPRHLEDVRRGPFTDVDDLHDLL